jgi:hypothetical protein
VYPESVGYSAPDSRYVGVRGKPVGQRDWHPAIRATKRVFAPLPSVAGARSSDLAEAVAGLQPDILIVPGLYAAYLARAAPKSHLWIDFFDLMSRYALLESEYLDAISRPGIALQRRTFARAEERYSQAAAAVSAAGASDTRVLSKRTGIEVRHLPTPIATPTAIPPLPGTATVGLIGSFMYQPNADAAEQLSRVWLPAIERAGWTIAIAGRDADQLRLPATVLNLGEVDSVAQFYSFIDAAVVPVRRGGGMKVKVIEALSWGRSVAATAFALEGFDDLPAAIVVERPDLQFPRDLPPPTNDERQHLRERYSIERFEADVSSIIEGILRK